MNESIIPGIVMGVIVAVAAGYVSHILRKREMQDLWAEEERRRKSDRRREGYEEELTVIKDSLDMLMAAVAKVEWSRWAEVSWESRAEWVREVYVTLCKAVPVTSSLKDDQLIETLNEAVDSFNRWSRTLNYATGKPLDGKEEEVENLFRRMQQAATIARLRAREMLEEA